jgi:hypothetical protein
VPKFILKNNVLLINGKELKLYMLMLGCTPAGRLTDNMIFFSNWEFLKDLIHRLKIFGLKPRKTSY